MRVPYYVVFSRYSDRVQFFQLVGGQYQAQPLDPENPRIWIQELNIGLGLWQGEFEGIFRHWLRWYDDQGNWLLTDAELAQQQVEQERQRANQAEAQILQVARNLLQTGMSIAQVSQITGLSKTEIQPLQPE